MAFYFKNTEKRFNMTKEDEEDFMKNNICRFCEKEKISDKVRDHSHLTGKNRGPVHKSCNIFATQKQKSFIPLALHTFSNYDCHLSFKKLVDKMKDKVKFGTIPKTNEQYISVANGCIRLIDRYRFLSSSLNK